MTDPLRVIEGERREEREPRFRLIPFDQIQFGRERRYLVKGLIPRVGLVVVWGPPKCGKSYWAFDLVLHVALGWEYRGRRVHQGPIIYAAFEGQSGLEARVEAFRTHRLAEDHDAVPFYLEPVTLDLVRDHGELIAVINSHLGETPPVAVVLDTLNRSLAGSESSDEDMSAYVRAADAIRDAFGCVVIIIHHCGVEGSRPRGHTSLTGAVDAQLSVKRDGMENIVVTVEMAKDGPQGDTITSRLEPVEVGTDEDGEPITSCVVHEAEGAGGKPRKMPKLTGAETVALQAIHEALADNDVTHPGLPQIPRGIPLTKTGIWRQYSYRKGISASAEDRARQAAFKRGYEGLQRKGVIAVWYEYVWLAR
jgi:hypothetical protein